ncbi:MAG: hypothetical protein WAV41_01705 [Microgenomates group bacterium]
MNNSKSNLFQNAVLLGSALIISSLAAFSLVKNISRVNAAAPCIITVFGQQYDVAPLQTGHSGGNIFVCGTDMTASYQSMHGTDVSRIAAYLITSTPTPTVTVAPSVSPTPTVTTTPTVTPTSSPSPTVVPSVSPTATPSVIKHDDDDENEIEDEHENENEDHDNDHDDNEHRERRGDNRSDRGQEHGQNELHQSSNSQIKADSSHEDD